MKSKLTAGKKSNLFDQLRDSPEWNVLSEEDLLGVAREAVPYSLEAGDFLFHEGDPCEGVYFVESGLVGVRKNGYEGHTTLIRVASQGNTLGYRPLLSEQPHRASADAIIQSVVHFLSAETCKMLIRANPGLGNNFLRRATRELGEAEARFHETVSLSVRSRFAHLLMVLKDEFGEETVDGTMRFNLPISRTDLAAMLGVRRESISRVIHDLEENEVARFHDRVVELLKPESLLAEFQKSR